MGSSAVTSDVWFRLYFRITVVNNEWIGDYGGGSAGFKIIGKWPGSENSSDWGFWFELDPNTNDPPNPPWGLRICPNNTLAPGYKPANCTINQAQWHCLELKAPLNSNNHVWDIYFDNKQIYSEDLGRGINFLGGDQWYGFFTNWYSTSAAFQQYIWTDGLGVKNNSRIGPASLVEIGNLPDYALATKKYQGPLFLSDGTVSIKADITGLGTGPYYLWVTNNRGERSAAYVLGGTGIANAKNHVSASMSLSAETKASGVNFGVNLSKPGDFVLRVLDIVGREVWQYAQNNAAAGTYRIGWNVRKTNVNAPIKGLYFVMLSQNNERLGQRLLASR
jgi:hypothetical protein